MKFQPGDIIAFHGTDFESKVIEFVTRGPSHVGIVSTLDGKPVLVESTSLCTHPCLVKKELVVGVQVQDIEQRLADYNYKAEFYRLMPAWGLDEAEQETLRQWLFSFVNDNSSYDFARAVLSSTSWLRFSLYPDEGTQFCSELCAGALMRLSRFPLSDPASYTPKSLIATLKKLGIVDQPKVVTA